MKVAAAIQNIIQCQHAINDKKKRVTTQISLDFFFFRKVDRIESSKEPESVPSAPGMSETAACPPSPIADDPSALPSPTSSPNSSQSLFLPVHLIQSLYQLLCSTSVAFKVLYYKIKKVLFLCLLFMYYLCESIINLLQYSTV